MDKIKEAAVKEYEAAGREAKSVLERVFGLGLFGKSIIDQVKTFADVCEAVGTTEAAFMSACAVAGLTPDEIGYRKVKFIAKVLNEGWVPNFNNSNEKKWWPWFKLQADFAYDATYYDYANAYACCGARLCFKTEALARYAGQQFLKEFEEYVSYNA